MGERISVGTSKPTVYLVDDPILSPTNDSIGDKLERVIGHVRGINRLYPNRANGVLLTADDDTAWDPGPITQVIPANTITSNFVISGIHVDNVSDATACYQVDIYYGEDDTFLGTFSFDANKFGGDIDHPFGSKQIPANSRIRAILLCDAGLGETIRFKINYTAFDRG